MNTAFDNYIGASDSYVFPVAILCRKGSLTAAITESYGLGYVSRTENGIVKVNPTIHKFDTLAEALSIREQFQNEYPQYDYEIVSMNCINEGFRS